MPKSFNKVKFLKPGEEDLLQTLSEEVKQPGPDGYSYVELQTDKNAVNNLSSVEYKRQNLSIFHYRRQFLYALQRNRVVIVCGETGSGKSTQLPQYIYESSWLTPKTGKLAVTQPRRVAALTLANRISEEKEWKIGAQIGYSIRFETDEDTSCLDNVCCLTVEGRQYPVKIFYSIDPVPCYIKAALTTTFEIHENKPAGGDILVFLTGQEEVCRLTSMIVEEYRARKERHMLRMSKKGNNYQNNYHPLRVLPFYGSLSPQHQMRVFSHTAKNCRKVVVATNLAETSLTIPGIVYVIDSGYAKIRAYNPVTGLEALITLPITKSSAQQRAGRAGRIRAGEAYRLYTESVFNEDLADFNSPESMRSDLSYALLRLKTLGIDNLANFNWPKPSPDIEHLAKAAERLVALGILEPMKGKLVLPRGLQIAELMAACGFSDPGAAVSLMGAVEEGCTQEVAAILALMQIQHIFVHVQGHVRTMDKQRRKYFGCNEGDHLTMLNAFLAYEMQVEASGEKRANEWCEKMGLNSKGLLHATLLRDRIKSVCKRMKLPWVKSEPFGNPDPVLRSFVRGFFTHVAILSPNKSEYTTLRGDHPLKIHPSSCYYAATNSFPQLILFTRVLLAGDSGETSYDKRINPMLFEGGTCVSEISTVQKEWLLELAPHYYRFGTDREHVEYAMKNRLKF